MATGMGDRSSQSSAAKQTAKESWQIKQMMKARRVDASDEISVAKQQVGRTAACIDTCLSQSTYFNSFRLWDWDRDVMT